MALTATWGTKSWNWGSAMGVAHDKAAALRRDLSTTEARLDFVQSLKKCAASFDDAKLCLALVWQQSARKGPLPPAFAEAYAELVAGAFEGEGADEAFARTMAPGIDRYCLNVRLAIKPERLTEFEAVIAQNERGTRTEPRNLRYSYGVEAESQKEEEQTGGAVVYYFFQEAFVGEKGFQAHASAPHFAKWEAFTETDPFAEAPQVHFWYATTNLADEAPPSLVAAAALASLDFIEDGWC